MKYDVAELLSVMLKEADIADVMEGDLNNHSTISLSMKEGIPTIHIRNEDDEVWVWAKVLENAPDSLAYCSANLLPLMMAYDEDFFYTGQPCLYPVDGSLELRAQVKEKHLQCSDDFLSMLDHYLAILQNYRSVLV
ncbi:secretory protein invB [Leclercia adecarboxylata]|nr:secretory protein invB [Leclercia adecarboxylata]KMN64118.1 secretory protein invB [Leclercia sp. LK8]